MTFRVRFARLALLGSCAVAAAGLATSAQAGDIAGTAVDGSGTRTLPGTVVELVELGRTTSAGPDGEFRFLGLPAGTYTLRGIYAGTPAEALSVRVPESGTIRTLLSVGDEAGVILVTGQQANLASSISRQRAADSVQSVLTRDAIGQFPDQNVAESIRRAPGINILNDQGEGRFVSVRGLDPNLNAASINGARIPAPESDVRSVALDVIPSELVESIEIKKTLTPDMDADTIGASIEINTTSAFDRMKPFFAVSAEGSYNDLTQKLSPKGSMDFATRLTENFGIAGGLSYYKRRFATDNIEAEGWNEAAGVLSPEKLEYRDYDVTRERIGASLSLDWRASDDTILFARGLYSRFEDHEYRKRLIFDLGDATPTGGTPTSTSYLTGEDNEITVERDLKDRLEVQKIASLSAGGKTETGPWTLRYEGSYARATEKENGSIDPIAFARDFDGNDRLGVDFDWSDYRKPGYTITEGNDLFLDPSGYALDKIERTTLSLAKDEEFAFRTDINRSFVLDSGTLEVQVGAKSRLRNKRYNLDVDIFEADGVNLGDVLGRQDYGLAHIDPVPGPGAVGDFLSGGFGGFDRDAVSSDFDSAAADYRVREDIYAGYVLGRYDGGDLRVIGGVRMEHTRNELRGNLVGLIEEGAQDGEDLVTVDRVASARRYTDWLPSLNIRYQTADDLVLRFGASKSVVRPTMGKLAPRFLVEESDDGEREGEFGNPDLDPYRAWNLDLSAEYYFGRNAVVQAGLFYKKIKNFIVDGRFDAEDAPFNGTFRGITFDEAVIPINGDDATVKGLEFSYQQALTFLPAPLDGMLVNFNYTYTDATGRLFDGRKIPLPAAAKHTFNAVLGYEKGPLSLRLAGAYRDGYLDELGSIPEEDRYVKDHFQLDVSAKYRVTPSIQIFAEWVNALDAPYIAYQKGPSAKRLLQYEEYSWTGKLGLRANF